MQAGEKAPLARLPVSPCFFRIGRGDVLAALQGWSGGEARGGWCFRSAPQLTAWATFWRPSGAGVRGEALELCSRRYDSPGWRPGLRSGGPPGLVG